MNIAYVIWIENIESPIIKGQVLDLLSNLSKNNKKKEKQYLILFQLFFFRPYSQIPDRFRLIRHIKKKLGKSKINLITVPVLGLPRTLPKILFNAKWYLLPLIFIQTFPAMLILCIQKKISLLHCRSYPITLPAIVLKKILHLKVIFDPRSDFPEENISAGNWSERSYSYKIWKYLERKYLRYSDATIAIAPTYIKHYRIISPKSKYKIIPNNVDVSRFKRNNEFRSKFRSKNNIEKNRLVFCYCGSMGKASWHTANIYAKYVLKLRKMRLSHHFLFITNSVEYLKKEFGKYDIRNEEYLCVSSQFSEVAKYLSAADVGIFFLNDYKISLAVKTIEYLAIGMPVITNSKAAGAKQLVEQFNAGLVLDLNDSIHRIESFCREFLLYRKAYSALYSYIARNLYSNDFIAKKYFRLYRDLLDSKNSR